MRASLLTVPQFTSPVAYFWELVLSRDFLIGAGLVIGGIAVAATGVGGPLLAAAISGGLISGGFSASSQKYATGDAIRKSRERIRSLWAVHQWLIGSVM
jgi:hypothetical protein